MNTAYAKKMKSFGGDYASNNLNFINENNFNTSNNTGSDNQVLDYIQSMMDEILSGSRLTAGNGFNSSFSNNESIGSQLKGAEFDREVQKNVNDGINHGTATKIADFNVNGNKEALDEYLPYKQSIKKNGSEPKFFQPHKTLINPQFCHLF